MNSTVENYAETEVNQKSDNLHNETQPAACGCNIKENMIDVKMEKELNSKILKITMTIKDKYPELSKYLEEMQETIPDEKKPEVTLKNLKAYYDSLNSMLNKYILEHSNAI